MVKDGIEVVNDPKYYTASRLPIHLKPQHYNLTLVPNLKEFTFTGTVEIIFKKTDAKISEIILNGACLEINNGHVELLDGSEASLKRIIYSSELETIALGFDLKEHFSAKRLVLEFAGSLGEKMIGFYKSSFKMGNQTLFAAVTQFEATFARYAFPCFDEPAMKATFDVIIIYDATPIKVLDKSYDVVALSNGDLLSEELAPDGKKIAKFETTPIMSTYLLALVVGPFEFIEPLDKTGNKCRVRVYTTPGQKEQGQFAADFTTKALNFYENYFGIDYPMSKLDLIAVPDFAFGAMENWGLITYREVRLLYDPKTSSTASKQIIAIIIAHELAHQWFGNLVTMGWWSDLWLNEGFASFMQYLCTATIYPEWDLWSQFLIDMWSLAMQKDSLHSSHPVEVPVNNASEIDQIFDEISYKKGCSIIRMLYNYIGDEMFRKGMTSYLKKFSYSNAVTNDLWKSLGDASGKPITDMMSAWTLKLGYPWIKVELIECNGEDATISLEQQIFTANGKQTEGDNARKWLIPVSIISGSPQVEPKNEFMSDKRMSISLVKQGNHWLKLNRGTIGFFRTAYSADLLTKLTDVIKYDLRNKSIDPNFVESLGPMDRLGIQNDYFALCQAGHVETGQLLKLLACYEDETDYTVWKSIDTCISALSTLYRNTQYSDSFKAFVRKLFGRIYLKLGWESIDPEEHTMPMLRALVLNRLVSAKHEQVIDTAKRMFHAQLRDRKMIAADLRDPVYTCISIHGDETEYNDLYKIRTETEAHEEKNRILSALSSATDPGRVERLIELILSPEVRIQDKGLVIMSLGASSPDLCWQLFKGQHEYFKKVYGTNVMMGRIIKGATEYFTSSHKLQEIEKFFQEIKFPGLEMPIEQSLETLRLVVDWFSRLANDKSAQDFMGQF